jgi:hypothetical protein
MRALDALAQQAGLDQDLAAPPAVPADGDRCIVAASPSAASGRRDAWFYL